MSRLFCGSRPCPAAHGVSARDRFATAAVALGAVGALVIGPAPGAAAQANPTPPASPASVVVATYKAIGQAMNARGALSSPAALLPADRANVSSSAAGKSLHQNYLAAVVQFRQWAEAHSEDYSRIDVSSNFQPAATRLQGNTAIVSGDEVFRLNLTVRDNGPQTFSPEKQAEMEAARRDGAVYEVGETIPASITIPHTVTLRRQSNGWAIEGDAIPDEQSPDSGLAGGAEPTLDSGLGAEAESTLDSGLAGEFDALWSASRLWTLNRAAAARYADRWCNAGPNRGDGYNPRYRNLNPAGGDCANFVSQVLGDDGAGNIDRTTSWKPYTFAWVNARGLYDYMKRYAGALSLDNATYAAARTFQRRHMTRADFIFYPTRSSRSGHVAVAAAKDANGNVLMNAHNNDRYHVPWDLGYGTRHRYYLVHLRNYK